ncbi:hypothetical protein LCGC14_2124050 [marine sediment metagenome]|uniref:ASCH domain-containing protein n=1 Tax=marine sediment metagenome TaxID=412755 RepID=A0A0F9E3F6_9ZZZZ
MDHGPDAMIALSIRQPYIELILRGIKKIEYRTRPTRRRERVYLYASTILADDPQSWAHLGLDPDELTRGRLVGTVEIVDCTGAPGDYQWRLARPERLAQPIRPLKRPQPMFFYPF